jgi:hypothetical protein
MVVQRGFKVEMPDRPVAVVTDWLAMGVDDLFLIGEVVDERLIGAVLADDVEELLKGEVLPFTK